MTIETAQAARADKVLNSLIRIDGVVTSWRDFVSRGVVTSEGDGMIDWSRTKFNRMNYREQAAYEAKLKAKRYYYVNDVQCPKTVWDFAKSMGF